MNREQLLPCYRAACEWGAHKFQVKPLIPSGRAAHSKSFLSMPEIVHLIGELSEAAANSPTTPEILCWPPEQAHGLTARACGNATKIYIGTDGSVSNCNFLAEPPFASLRDQSLESICQHRQLVLQRPDGRHNVLAGCPAWECWRPRLLQDAPLPFPSSD